MQVTSSEPLHVAVVDVGSLEKLGWAVEGPSVNEAETDINLCIEALAKAVKTGPPALGFETPMFVPYGRERDELDKARKGEGTCACAPTTATRARW